jgi:hypothetical protein
VISRRPAETGPADAVTQDLLTGLTADLEKQSWMFRAGNQGGGGTGAVRTRGPSRMDTCARRSGRKAVTAGDVPAGRLP